MTKKERIDKILKESHLIINDESLIDRQKVSLYGLSVNYKHKILKSNFYLGASYFCGLNFIAFRLLFNIE